MSLDVSLEGVHCSHCNRGGEDVYHANITHNLGGMAEAAGIYKALWRPEEIGITHAKQLIEPLRAGVVWLREHETEARKHDAPNGWGLYEHFLPFVEKYLEACIANPETLVRASR